MRSTGGIPKSRVNRISSHHHSQNGEYAVEYPVEYSLVKKLVADNAAAPQIFMPYMGTYYYNGVPSYANMDSSSLKEAIRKQMYEAHSHDFCCSILFFLVRCQIIKKCRFFSFFVVAVNIISVMKTSNVISSFAERWMLMAIYQ